MYAPTILTDERAVSPVVGVTLLIGIAVILAAVIGGVVLGIGLGPSDAPQASLEAQGDSTELNISHAGGDPLPADQIEVRGSAATGGTTLADYTGLGDSDELKAGETVTIPDSELDSGELSLVYVADGEETVIATFDVPA